MADTCELCPKPDFDPRTLGLPDDFILTDYTRLKGCSCKIPQPKLLELLRGIATTPGAEGAKGDVGMDCSITALKSPAVQAAMAAAGKGPASTVSTTDFFFPSVDDPYLQGRIGCANVLSDMYSMGITHTDSLLMLLAASVDMEEKVRYAVTLEIMRGFADTARDGGVTVTGGQSVFNPWPIIGGVAMTTVVEEEMVRPIHIVAGDVLVLTKPLGTQLAVNLHQAVRRPTPLYEGKVRGNMAEADIALLYDQATHHMARLNRNGAGLMHKHGAHAATDVTGFGLLGHARNLAEAQTAEIAIEIHTLPLMAGAAHGDALLGGKYKLLEGLSAETSGGLLVALKDRATAEAFVADIEAADGEAAWIVAEAVARPNAADLTKSSFAWIKPDCAVLEVVGSAASCAVPTRK
jgi:selenide,water dikinase